MMRCFRARLGASLALLLCLATAAPARAAGTDDSGDPGTTVPESTLPAPATGDATAPQVGDIETIESWGLGPVGSQDASQPSGRIHFTYDADPGAVIHDAAVVYNFGNVPLTFRVYATDGTNTSAGVFDLLPADEPPSDVGSWVTMDAPAITVPPLKQAIIPMTITVPADARPGDHVGGVVASSPVEGSNDTGQKILLDRRTGAKLYVRVRGQFHPELAITNLDTSYAYAVDPFDGVATVKFRVENRGDVRLDGTPHVRIAGPFGIGERDVTLPTLTDLLPGKSADLTAVIPKVGAWFVDWTTVEIEPGGTSELGALSETRGTGLKFVPPISVLIALVVVLVLILVWRRHRRRQAEDDALFAGEDQPLIPEVVMREHA